MNTKRILMSMLIIFFPWIAMIMHDNPGGALVTLFLQATLVGWIPASIWAWRTVYGKPSTASGTRL